MSSESTPLASEPASSAEGVQPSTEVVDQSTAAEGTGASEQVAEQEEQRRASEAGRTLAEQRRKNAAAARFRQEQEELRRTNAELTRALIQATQGKQQPSPSEANDEPPKREAFESFEEWNRADARYWAKKEAQETLRTQLEQLSKQAQEQQARQVAEQVEQAHQQRLGQFVEKSPEFAQLLEERGSQIRIPDATAHAIMFMDDGPQIMEAMLQYPQLAQKFWEMSPHEQLMSLGKVSAALQSRPQVSKAPAPGNPVGSRGGPQGSPKTREEYFAEITKGWKGKK